MFIPIPYCLLHYTTKRHVFQTMYIRSKWRMILIMFQWRVSIFTVIQIGVIICITRKTKAKNSPQVPLVRSSYAPIIMHFRAIDIFTSFLHNCESFWGQPFSSSRSRNRNKRKNRARFTRSCSSWVKASNWSRRITAHRITRSIGQARDNSEPASSANVDERQITPSSVNK